MLQRSIIAVSTFIVALVTVNALSNAINEGHQNSFVITDANWTMMLNGEWLVKFYAPWCPACRNLEPTWKDLAEWATGKDIQFGGVDVTQESGLSGRFVITSLPTIYHVKDGIFRQYAGPRAMEDFQEYIDLRKWNDTEPVPNWKAPDSFLMSGISKLFGFSLQLKDLHTYVTEKYGVPVWASFVLFGVIVVLLGLLLGMILVILSDYFYGPPTYESMDDVQGGVPLQGMHNGESDSDSHISSTQQDISTPTDNDRRSVRQRKAHFEDK